MKMTDWIQFLHKFLELSNYSILSDKGKITALIAKLKATSEYDAFRIIQDQDYLSDFDKELIKMTDKMA